MNPKLPVVIRYGWVIISTHVDMDYLTMRIPLNYKFTIWCRDDENSVFSVAHCLSDKEADATCGLFLSTKGVFAHSGA